MQETKTVVGADIIRPAAEPAAASVAEPAAAAGVGADNIRPSVPPQNSPPPEPTPAFDLEALISDVKATAEASSKAAAEKTLERAKMSEADRKAAEIKDKEDALTARETLLARREMEAEAKRLLAETNWG